MDNYIYINGFDKIKFKKINKHYSISEDGRLYSHRNKIILKTVISWDGYEKVGYSINGKKIDIRIHRLVAIAFIPNPDNKETVNHIDGNKLNNHYTNLEWNTVSENTIHAYENKLNSLNLKVKVKDLITDEIKTYRSIQYLAGELGVTLSTLRPYIRFSSIYPFMGRYVIKLEDEESFVSNFNSENFGRPIYILDYITRKITRYQSSGMAMYFTGLKSINKLKDEFLKTLGYSISNEDDLFIDEDYDIDLIKINRDKYLSTKYKSNANIVVIKDFFNNDKISVFNTYNDFVDFIFLEKGIKIKNSMFIDKKTKPNYTSKLFLGYNIQLIDKIDDIKEWSAFTYEEYYNSKSMKKADSPVFSIKYNNKTTICNGIYEVLKHIRPLIPEHNIMYRRLAYITLEDVKKVLDSLDITIDRLNKMKI